MEQLSLFLGCSCANPQMRAVTSYREGCRCERCREAAAVDRQAWRRTAAGKDSAKRSNRKRTRSGKKKAQRKIDKARRKQQDQLPAAVDSRGDLSVYGYSHPIIETHVDHVLPLALGGITHESNLCVLTAYENSVIKSAKHPAELDLHTVPLAGVFRWDGYWLDVETLN